MMNLGHSYSEQINYVLYLINAIWEVFLQEPDLNISPSANSVADKNFVIF